MKLKISIVILSIVLLFSTKSYGVNSFRLDLKDLNTVIDNSDLMIISEITDTNNFSDIDEGIESFFIEKDGEKGDIFMDTSKTNTIYTVKVKNVIHGEKKLKNKEIDIIANSNGFDQKSLFLGSEFFSLLVKVPNTKNETYMILDDHFSIFPKNNTNSSFSVYESFYVFPENISLKAKLNETSNIMFVDMKINLKINFSTISL